MDTSGIAYAVKYILHREDKRSFISVSFYLKISAENSEDFASLKEKCSANARTLLLKLSPSVDMLPPDLAHYLYLEVGIFKYIRWSLISRPFN
jgi:hypothetical protein